MASSSLRLGEVHGANAILCLHRRSVRAASTPNNFGSKGYLKFEHVTLSPIQTSLIDGSLLNTSEKTWINNYHDEVYAKVAPVLEKMGSEGELGLAWLKKHCEARV